MATRQRRFLLTVAFGRHQYFRNISKAAKLGASIVVLPGGEVFSALDKGVVDAADWATISMNERMGFHSVAKYPTKVFHSMPVQEFSVNIAAWKALPDDIKGILHSVAREWSWDQVQRVAVDDAECQRRQA
jgi:TRAP-type mannitol/chloroaromatic compound transport system substrate-binding protein